MSSRRRHGIRSLRRRSLALLALLSALIFSWSSPASAHPLGNFTTNTATHLLFDSNGVEITYIVDMAEIPALQVRQELEVPSGPVPASTGQKWSTTACSDAGRSLELRADGTRVVLRSTSALVGFPRGQAGLSTLRLECHFRGEFTVDSAPQALQLQDGNFPGRIGWREITGAGTGVELKGSIAAVSPSKSLTAYPTDALASPREQKEISVQIHRAENATANTAPNGGPLATSQRGNDGLTERFQGLVAQRNITLPFAVGALLLATLLGGMHALAPGHGKTIMAAYAVSQRGTRRDMISIGATVALTHTVGIIILGILVSATSSVSPSSVFRWASLASGVLVFAVGLGLIVRRRGSVRLRRTPKVNHEHGDHEHGDHEHGDHEHHDHEHCHDHEHSKHEHCHDHEHSTHEHGHDNEHSKHEHGHDHEHGDGEHGDHEHSNHKHAEPNVQVHHRDARFVVTSHAHGGRHHRHILPAPGVRVRRSELIVMGLAGGMVPSPSALVVLLGAIALGRIPFGIALVCAYGIGLAATLVAAGLLLVRFEGRARRWSTTHTSPLAANFQIAISALPLLSGFAIAGAGLLLVLRSLQAL